MADEIPIVFHRASNYDYHFIIKELANEFEGQFERIRENKEKHKNFCLAIKTKIIKIDNDGNELLKVYLTK